MSIEEYFNKLNALHKKVNCAVCEEIDSEKR